MISTHVSNPPASIRTGDLARYFWPLALQAASQSLSYPLVAIVASQGQGGPLNLAGLAQSNGVMFLLGTLGAGSITAGMVFANNQGGYRRFARMNCTLGLITVVVQAVMCVPEIGHWLFGTLIRLPPAIEMPARITLLAAIPMQFLFFLRAPYQVVLYINKATGRASAATMGRIVLTLLLAPLFCAAGFVGPLWAVVCQTIPVALEVIISRQFASAYLGAMPEGEGTPPGVREMYLFAMPLSIGGFFLSLSGIVNGAIIARAADPERMLPVFYLAVGLAGPMAYAATRLQAVVLAFWKSTPRRSLFRFSLIAGAATGILPLLFILPGAATLYYVTVQHLDAGLLPAVRIAALALAVYPLSVAVRAFCEGVAAAQRKPLAILAGQSVFLAALVIAGAGSLALSLPGNLIGPASLIAANAAAAAIVYMSITWGPAGGAAAPVIPTRASDQES